jgi:hypothetical protein
VRQIILPVIAGLALVACGGIADAGGDAGEGGASKTFPVTAFDRVALDGPDDVVVTKGPAAVRAEGSDEVLAKLRIEVRDGQLHVGRVPNSGTTVINPMNWKGKGRAKVFVTVPAVRGADLSGAGRFTVENAATPEFAGSIGGAGKLTVNGLAARNATFEMSGAGSLVLAGTADALRLSMSGAGSVDAEALTAKDLAVSMSGVGGIKARATGRVTGDVSGVGSVKVTGTTDCHVEKSGVGSIKCGL